MKLYEDDSMNFVDGLNLTVIYFNNSIRVTSPVFLINTIDQTSFEEFCSRSNVVTTIKEWSFYLCLHIFCCHYVVHSKTLWINVSKCPKNTFEGISSILNVSKTTRKNKWEVVASNSQNEETLKKPTYQKRSHISLQLCWISERAFVH